MTSPTPEVREEILQRAARLLAVNGHRFSSQHELMLKGLDYDVIIVRFLDDNKLIVFWDTPRTMCVASSDPDTVPDIGYVCQNTAEKVLGLLRRNMILDDIAYG